MKIRLLPILVMVMLYVSCQEDNSVFEKSADQRVAEAIDSLKSKLIAPPNGWVLQYRPEQASGSFIVLLKFDEDNNVNIRTDFGVNDGEFYDQTITYRIDNSLGLELILENYSFFSYLFEQEDATYLAEYEFNYVNETNGALIFRSKTDYSSPTTLVFQPAAENDENMLGITLASNLNTLADNLDKVTSVFKLSYTNKDLAFYISFDEFRRTINFNYAGPASGLGNGQSLNFSTGYLIQGDSMIFNTPFSGNILGQQVSISSIQLNELTNSSLDACGEPIVINSIKGMIPSSNDAVALETTLFDPTGADFQEASNFFYSPVQLIFNNGTSAGEQIEQDITGALDMQLYYDDNLEDPFLALGFRIQNDNATNTWALRDFSPVIVGNQIQFEFAPNYTLYGDTTVTVDEEKMNIYLNTLTEGGSTYIFKFSETIFEFYNPCNGWSFVFIAPN